jgi:hypothetical protein
MKVLLRIVLSLLVVLAGLGVGVLLAPRSVRNAECGMRNTAAERQAVQPDWGGGRLSLPARSRAGTPDLVHSVSVKKIQDSRSKVQDVRTWIYSGWAGGMVLRRKSGADYALTMAIPASGQPGRSGVFELSSSGHFRKQLLPEEKDAAAPAADIPLYPLSSCRMQVGQGTAYFFGFYFTPDGVEKVRAFYARVLSQLGWQRVTADREGHIETFAKSNEDRTVVVQLREQDSVTTRIGLVATTQSGQGTRFGTASPTK